MDIGACQAVAYDAPNTLTYGVTMGSETAPQDTPLVNESASEAEERVIGGRATRDQIYLIDRAALEVGLARGPFIVEAAVEKARTVMAAKVAIEQPADNAA